jgi:AcrR family transcriptional regulator
LGRGVDPLIAPGSSAKPRRRSAARRERVLEAAIAAICERGLSDTRVSDIAHRAGMSAGNVMYYFATLEEMLIEALRFANDGFLDQALRDAEQEPSAPGQLLRLIELGMPSDPAEEPHSQWLLWLDVWARSPRNPTVDAHRRELERHWMTAYAQIIERGQSGGEFSSSVDGHDFAVRLCALIDGLGKSVVLGDPWMTRSRMLEICAGMIQAELGVAGGR